jgi:hypothetical protein
VCFHWYTIQPVDIAACAAAQVDVYGFGITLWEILFSDTSPREAFNFIIIMLPIKP